MSPTSSSSDRTSLFIALAIACVAFAARLLPIFVVPGINHPDEIFQSLEPAHRLVFGYGLDTITRGLRSWIMPGTIAALIEVSRVFDDGPGCYVPFVQTIFAAFSTSAVALTFLWATRLFGRWPALAAASLPAFWPDALYFAGRTLSEPVAATLLVLALYLVEPGYEVTSRRRLAIGGALLALAFVIRIQLAPTLAVAAVWTWARAPRHRFVPLAGGILATLALSGVLDWVTAGYPFAPAWRNFSENLFDGVASSFGTAPWFFYLAVPGVLWGLGGVALLVLGGVGARRMPLLPLLALVTLAAHSVIPHKEYRFIYPALLLLLVGAGLGLAQLVAWLDRSAAPLGAPPGFASSIGAIAAVAAIGFLSLGMAMSAPEAALWRERQGMREASMLVSRLPSVCGIGTEGIFWWDTGGYTLFHRNVPFYWPMTAAQFAHDSPGFDTLIAPRGAPVPPGYARRQCFGGFCVEQRPGGCQPIPMAELSPPSTGNVLRRAE